MIEINATGDTTLHTAGKYCAEDILVKVPAGGSTGGSGGSGGTSVETCTVELNSELDLIMVAGTTITSNGFEAFYDDSGNKTKTYTLARNSMFSIITLSGQGMAVVLIDGEGQLLKNWQSGSTGGYFMFTFSTDSTVTLQYNSIDF